MRGGEAILPSPAKVPDDSDSSPWSPEAEVGGSNPFASAGNPGTESPPIVVPQWRSGLDLTDGVARPALEAGVGLPELFERDAGGSYRGEHYVGGVLV